MFGRFGKGRGIRRRSAGLAVLLVVLCGWTFAQSDADSELVTAISGKRKVRVFTPSGPLVLWRPAVTEDGLAGHGMSEGVEKLLVVPWSDVRGLQVRRSGAGKGALIVAFGISWSRSRRRPEADGPSLFPYPFRLPSSNPS